MPECPRPFAGSGSEGCRTWESVFNRCAVDPHGEKARDKCISPTHRINRPRPRDTLTDGPCTIAEDSATLALRNANHRDTHGVNSSDERFRLSIREVRCG